MQISNSAFADADLLQGRDHLNIGLSAHLSSVVSRYCGGGCLNTLRPSSLTRSSLSRRCIRRLSKLARLLYRNWGAQGPHWRQEIGTGLPRTHTDGEDSTLQRHLASGESDASTEDRGRTPYKPAGIVDVKPVRMPRAIVQHTPLAIRLTEPITYLRGEFTMDLGWANAS